VVRLLSAHLHQFFDVPLRETGGRVREPGVDLDRRPGCSSAEVGDLEQGSPTVTPMPPLPRISGREVVRALGSWAG
jgi:hypothetical protein